MEISGYSPKDERWSQTVNCKRCKLALTIKRSDLFVCNEWDITGKHDDVSVQCPGCKTIITLASYGDQRDRDKYADIYGSLPTYEKFLEDHKNKVAVVPRAYFSKAHLGALQKALADAKIQTTDFVVLVAALEQHADVES